MGLEIFREVRHKKTPTVIPVVIPEGIDGEKKCGAYYWIILKLKLPLPSVI